MNSVLQVGVMCKWVVGVAVGLLLGIGVAVGCAVAQEMPGGCWVQPDGSVWCTVVQVFLPIINQ